MKLLFCWLLIISPLRIPVEESWYPYLSKDFWKLAELLEMEDPKYAALRSRYNYEHRFQSHVRDQRYRYRKLANAPSIERAKELPEYEICISYVKFWETYKDNLRDYMMVFGRSNKKIYKKAMERCDVEIEFWFTAAGAALEVNGFYYRRICLQRVFE